MPRIGIDLGGTKIEAVLLSDDGTIEVRHRIKTPRDDYHGTVRAISMLVDGLDQQVGRRLPVGVGTPGTLQPATGTMKNCNSTWLNGRPLLQDLIATLGLRVRIANDANCFALSEATDGAAAGARMVFGVILGTGVGGGIVANGQLHAGANGIAGEWGHTPLAYLGTEALAEAERRLPDRACYCGRMNCIETFLSGPGLAETHRSRAGARLPPEAIVSMRTPQTSTTLDLYLRQLARSLAQVINVLDPDVIVVGGGLSDVDAIYDRVPALWKSFVFSPDIATRLVRAAHGPAGGVRGAAWLWPPDYNCDSA